MTIKDWIGRLARWALFLQEFEFEIEYKKGATHANADVLSRPILLVTTRKSANEVELPLKFDDSHDYIALMHLLGHFQAETTFERPKDFYFWKKMPDDVEFIVKSCPSCQRNELKHPRKHPAMPLPISELFEPIGIDLVLGLPMSKNGYIGIITIVESISKSIKI